MGDRSFWIKGDRTFEPQMHVDGRGWGKRARYLFDAPGEISFEPQMHADRRGWREGISRF